MKRNLLILFVLFFQFLSANDIVSNLIKLPKNYKVESTFSGDLSNNESFHLILTKNKKSKTFEVFSYLYDGKEIKKLASFVSNSSYNVVSFHQKGDILSLLMNFKEKKKSFIKRIDYNLKTIQKTETEPFSHKDFLTSIRQDNASILLYNSKDNLSIVQFNGSEKPLIKTIEYSGKEDKIKQFIDDGRVTSIKNDEYVANGAISKLRLYYEGNTLSFTRDSDEPLNIGIAGISLNNKRANKTKILKINLNKSPLNPKILNFDNKVEEKFKKATSYYLNNKLYQLALSKKTGFIKISDTKNGSSLNTISLDESVSKYAKGNSDFQGITKFLKNAGKNKYNATITANKTKSDAVRVRVDYVNIEYSYNYNWWWHHQNMMWHHQMHMNNVRQNFSVPSGFGPSIFDDYAFETATVIKEKRHFEFLITDAGQLSDDELPELLYTDIDKKNYIDKLDDLPKIEHESSCFLEGSFRYIFYSKKLKSFEIKSQKL